MGEGWVYFVEARSVNRVKIGFSAENPDGRFATLDTGSPVTLTRRALVWGGRDVEFALHDRFRRHRIKGEWFHAAPEIEAFVRKYGMPWAGAVAVAAPEMLADLFPPPDPNADFAERYEALVDEYGPEDEHIAERQAMRARGLKTIGPDSYAETIAMNLDVDWRPVLTEDC